MRTNGRKSIALILVFVSVSILFSGCGRSKDNLKDINLCEVAHSVFYAPQYVAIELGYFEQEGIDIHLKNGAGADKVMTALLSGSADIGFMGTEASVYVYQEGEKDYVVNFAGLTQRAGNFLVGREKNGSFDWNSLKGKTVLGGRKGGMPEMVFEYILKKKGIDPEKDLTIVKNIDFGLTAAAYSNGQGDYTVEFEPFATALEIQQEGAVVASLGEESGYIPYTAYSTRKSYMEKNEETLISFTRAVQKGLDYVNTHSPEEIAAVIQPQFKETDSIELQKIVERYHMQDTWKENVLFDENSFVLLEDILMDAGELEEKVPYNDLVNTEIANKALK